MTRGASKPGIGEMAAALRKQFTNQHGLASMAPLSQGMLEVGIPLDGALPLQYVLGTNVIVLGRCLNIIGKSGSGKSQLAWELARRVLPLPGMVKWFETENKAAMGLIRSILRVPDEVYDTQIDRIRITDAEDYMNKASTLLDEYFKVVKGKYPLVQLTDSLSDLVPEESIALYEKSGNPGEKGYADAQLAAKFTKHFKAMNLLYFSEKAPVLLILVNHMKVQMQQGQGHGPPDISTGVGGVQKDFQATWTLLVSAGKTIELGQGAKKKDEEAKEEEEKQEDDLDFRATTVHYVKAYKNSMGVDKRTVEYMVHHFRDQDGTRVTHFDWDSALGLMLLKDPSIPAALIKDLGITGSGNKVSCGFLKLKEGTRAELGRRLHASPEAVKLMQEHLFIEQFQPFKTAEAKAEAKAKEKTGKAEAKEDGLD